MSTVFFQELFESRSLNLVGTWEQLIEPRCAMRVASGPGAAWANSPKGSSTSTPSLGTRRLVLRGAVPSLSRVAVRTCRCSWASARATARPRLAHVQQRLHTRVPETPGQRIETYSRPVVAKYPWCDELGGRCPQGARATVTCAKQAGADVPTRGPAAAGLGAEPDPTATSPPVRSRWTPQGRSASSWPCSRGTWRPRSRRRRRRRPRASTRRPCWTPRCHQSAT